MINTSVASLRVFSKPRSPRWDLANNRIGDFAVMRANALFRTLDWGLGNQLIALTGGSISVDDNWPQFIDVAKAKQVIESRPTDKDLYLISYVSGKEVFPDAARNCKIALNMLHITPEDVAILQDVDNRPLIKLQKISPPKQSQY